MNDGGILESGQKGIKIHVDERLRIERNGWRTKIHDLMN